jgi:GTP-binding protein
MLTDEVKIKIHSGRGGNGVVAFSKIKMSLGPTGGRGGDGGDIYFKGVSDLTALNKYKSQPNYYAGDGQNGGTDKSTGSKGNDLTLTIPIGSVIHNLETKEDLEITKINEVVKIAQGGFGGRGNFYFRSPVNTSPQKAEEGKPGQKFNLIIELRLIADIGLVGLPNAGKSSLLNELTKANVKVADYEFTTLEPNLGALEKIILADIPGLIEGASKGRGLGIKFLKHIQRTKILFHCIALDAKDILRNYEIVRKELRNYNKELLNKNEILIFTKSDLVDNKEIIQKTKIFKDKKKIIVSIHDFESLERLKKEIKKLVKEA